MVWLSVYFTQLFAINFNLILPRSLQALSKALLDLKADLVTQAQSDVLVNAERAAVEVNVQRIVDKRTKELQVCSLCMLRLRLVNLIRELMDWFTV